MSLEIVRVTTPDGIRLDGALHAADAPPEPEMPLDAALLWHGTGANFYSSTLLDVVAGELRKAGVATLLANTRGHDLVYVAATSGGPRRLGAAYEVVDDCRHDLHAWIDLLFARGYRRLGVFGHSLGGIKAIYALAHNDRPDAVVRVCAISPARLSYHRFSNGPLAAEFSELIQSAEALVREGRGEQLLDVKIPIPYLVTAAGFLDKYGTSERYNILQLLPRLSVPTLVTLGTAETETHDAFRGLPEEIESLARSNRHLELAVVAGADHVYAGMRTELCARIFSWLRPGKKARDNPGKPPPARGKKATWAKAPAGPTKDGKTSGRRLKPAKAGTARPAAKTTPKKLSEKPKRR